MRFPNTFRRLPGDLREMPAVRPSTPLHPLYLVIRWLAPWAVVLAMSTVIAHTADALLIPSNSVEVVASDPARPTQVQTLVALEPEGVLTRVNCPADADTAVHEVLIISLQDLQALEAGRCEMHRKLAELLG